jgi:hypothetical protein
MKMFLIVYCQAADYDVIASLKSFGIKGYTKMEQVSGEGTDTEPKLGTHIWPGRNNMLLLAIANEDIPKVTNLIRQMREEHPRSGIKGFILPMEESI